MKPSSIFPEKALAVLGVRSGKPQDSYTRADRIFEGLSEAILAGYLEPQMKLPSEGAMALHFGVSRPVIRRHCKGCAMFHCWIPCAAQEATYALQA